MPIVDRRHNLKLLSEAIKQQQPKDDNNLSMDDMLTDRKNLLRSPDYTSKMPRK